MFNGFPKRCKVAGSVFPGYPRRKIVAGSVFPTKSSFVESKPKLLNDNYTVLCIPFAENSNNIGIGSTEPHIPTWSGTEQYVSEGGHRGAYFNGASYVDYPDSNDWFIGGGDFTIDFWLYPYTLSTEGCIAGQTYIANAYIHAHYLQMTAIGKLYYAFGRNTANAQIQIYSSVFPEPYRWYHIAIVRSGNDYRMYRDRALYAAAYSALPPIDYVVPFRIGAFGYYQYGNPVYNWPFRGLIRNFRLHKTSRDINVIYKY